jgi:hypothetical protein
MSSGGVGRPRATLHEVDALRAVLSERLLLRTAYDSEILRCLRLRCRRIWDLRTGNKRMWVGKWHVVSRPVVR